MHKYSIALPSPDPRPWGLDDSNPDDSASRNAPKTMPPPRITHTHVSHLPFRVLSHVISKPSPSYVSLGQTSGETVSLKFCSSRLQSLSTPHASVPVYAKSNQIRMREQRRIHPRGRTASPRDTAGVWEQRGAVEIPTQWDGGTGERHKGTGSIQPNTPPPSTSKVPTYKS